MLAIAGVALRRFLRERSNLFFVFVLPFLIIFLVGAASGARADAPLAIVGAENQRASRVIEQLEPDSYLTFDDEAEALDAVGELTASAVVIFDADESAPVVFRSRNGDATNARVEFDAAVASVNQQLVIERQAALVGLDAAAVDQVLRNRSATPIETESIGQVVWKGLANIEASAMTQVVLFMFLSALTAATFLVQDRHLGMATRKASTPTSIGRLVGGETLGRFGIAAFQAVLIVAVTGLLFGVGWGDPLATTLLLAAFALVATGAGVLLGAVFDNAEAATGGGIMIALVLAALGGAMAPVEIFPNVMQTIAKFTPHYWAIDGLQTSLIDGGITDVGQPLFILMCFAVGILVVSTFAYRWRTFSS